MSAAVETMAYTNEVPWHGLGTYVADAPSVDEMLTLAGLDWGVEKWPLFTDPDGDREVIVKVPDHFALIRTGDQKVLDVVGNHYTPIQNAEAFEFFREFVEAGDATMETAGSLRGGRMVWGLANLKSSFTLGKTDRVNGYLLVAAPHEAGKAYVARHTSVRVVCNNTLTLALGNRQDDQFRMAHRKKFDAAMVEKAKVTLGVARKQFTEFEKNARILHGLNLSREQVVNILAPVYQPQTNKSDVVRNFDEFAVPRLKQVMGAYEKAPGAEPGTGWGVLNAVTYYADHIASRTSDKRLTNAWFGKTANQKTRVLNDLLEIAS